MIPTGKFIVIEGLEGAGKSTAVSIVKTCIEQAGHSLTCTREPGGTAMAEAIRECVKKDWQDETVTTEAELLLMYAARAQLLFNVIHPALKKGARYLSIAQQDPRCVIINTMQSMEQVHHDIKQAMQQFLAV